MAMDLGRIGVWQGAAVLTPQLAQDSDADDPLARLSPREREVLQLVAEGHTNTEIANKLHLSPKTVETYRFSMMKKLKLRNLPELIRLAISYGLTPLD